MNRRELVWRTAVVAAGLAIAAVYAWPGYMAWDSVDQLAQARSGQLTDWHPPMMSAVWGVLDRVIAGPVLLFVLQCGMFLGGLHALLRRRMSEHAAALATLAIFALPPTLTLLAVVVKDSLMCGALLVGCAGLTSGRRGLAVASLVAFGFAAALRHNAFTAVIPLIAWLSPWPRTRGPWLRRSTGAVLGLVVCAAAFFANRALDPAPAHLLEYGLLPQDVAGTLCYAPELSDPEVRALVPDAALAPGDFLQSRACALAAPETYWENYIRGPRRLLEDPTSPERREALATAWRAVVRAYPGAYLWERLDRFRMLLGLTDVPWTPVYAAAHEHAMQVNTRQPEHVRNAVQRWLSRRMIKLGRSSLLFRPYVYLLLALGLLVVRRRDPLTVALIASTLAYLGGLVFVSPAPDIRYAQWLIVCTPVAIALHVFGRRDGGPLERQPESSKSSRA